MPGFPDIRRDTVALETYSNIVAETSKGLNIALFVILITGTRIDREDVRDLQILGALLTRNGVKHIAIVFT